MKHQFALKLGDIILMSVICLMTVFLFLLPLLTDKGSSAEIYIVETDEIKNISLSENATYDITSRGISLTVCVSDGEVSISRSDCRDGICSNTPPISRAGQSIVCAPAGVVVRIVGEGAIVDAVS